MKLYAVKIGRDESVQVVEANVIKQTPQFYFIEKLAAWDDHNAFHYTTRQPKRGAFTTARAAITAYMERRQRQKADMLSAVGQATKQIASANELLMHLPVDEPPAADAVARGVGEGQIPTARA